MGRGVHLPLVQIVPGDIVQPSAGNLASTDLRVRVTKDMFVSRAALIGEAMPMERLHDAILAAYLTLNRSGKAPALRQLERG